MRFRELGKTGVEVSVVGFGASPLGNVFGEVSTVEDDAAVGTAIEHGINLFDVSPYYGLTVAESRLGAALEGRRTGVYLATKCGRYGTNQFDFSARAITEGLEASLRRLRTDHVDILQAHDVEFACFEKVLNETIPALQQLRRQGKVRWIGVTGYWPGHLARIVESAEMDVVLNYCHGNLFADDMNRELGPVAATHGVGLLNASPLHMGLLSNRPVPEWHPASPEVKAAAAAVLRLCLERGADAVQVALQYCLRLPLVSSTFVGICSAADAVAAARAVTDPPDDSLLSDIEAILRTSQNRHWESGRSENAAMTPQGRSFAHQLIKPPSAGRVA